MWGFGALLPNCLQRQFPALFDNEFGTKTIFENTQESSDNRKESESENMQSVKEDRSGTRGKCPAGPKAPSDTKRWSAGHAGDFPRSFVGIGPLNLLMILLCKYFYYPHSTDKANESNSYS